jgi:hypothetical protein
MYIGQHFGEQKKPPQSRSEVLPSVALSVQSRLAASAEPTLPRLLPVSVERIAPGSSVALCGFPPPDAN